MQYDPTAQKRPSNWARAFLITFVAAFGTVLFSGLAVPAAQAQYRASLRGVVSDPTGAVIPGAAVTLTNKDTGEKLASTTDDGGIYNFNALPPGHFSVTVERDGFKKQVVDNIAIIPEQPNALNLQLQLGETTQTVAVNGSEIPAIDTATASIGGTISSNDIQHLPSFNRDVFQLTQLIPGAVSDGSQNGGGGTYSLPGTQGPGGTGTSGQAPTENGPQANANGGQYETNSITLDGISTVSAVWGGTTIITPTEDSIGNVRIVTNDYDAENGRFSGAQTMVTSKSGTNEIHGSLFIAIHRPGLNAYQRYNGPGSLTNPLNNLKDTARFNQYGGSVGGPIWKNRVFAFFAYESSPNNSNSTTTGWYETTAFEALAPANSIASEFLKFPGGAVASTGLIEQTCANVGLVEGKTCHQISGAGLNIGSPLTTPLGTQDPTATGTSIAPGVGSGLSNVADIADFATSSPFTSYYTQYNGRLDADVTKKDHASFAIYWVPQGNTSYNGGARAYNLFHHAQINDAFSVIWNHVFSSSLLNEARANAAGWRWNEIADNPQAPVGLPDDQVNQIGSLSPNLNQFGSALGSDLNQWTYEYKDVATKVHGQHTVKFGGDYTNLHYLNNPIGRPNYYFYNVWDFLNDAPNEESGSFNTVTGLPGGSRADNRENLLGFFAQDSWKVKPNITINLGIRYSYFGPLYNKQNNLSVTLFGSGAGYLSGINLRQGGNLWVPQKGNLGPQFGFNWAPSQLHDKLVVRGGYGLSFNQEEIAISANSNYNPPTAGYYDFTSASPSNINPNISYGISSDAHSLSGFAPNPNTITSYNSNFLPTAGNASVTGFPNHLPTAYAHHYSLDTQYDLGHQLIASIGYQGSASHHLIVQYNANATALAQGLTLNPLITNTDLYGNEGGSNNNSMLAELKYSRPQTLSLDAQFAWAKSMDDTSGPYSEDPYYPLNPSYARGRSDFNVGKSFKVFGLWQPVIFHGGYAWAEKVVGGWSLSGIFTIHSGFGWTPNYGVGQSLYCSNCGYYNLRPKYLGGGGKSTSNDAFKTGSNFANLLSTQNTETATINGNAGTVVAYSNTLFSVPNFAAAMSGSFPSTAAGLPPPSGLSRNSFNGPGYKDVDASLTKAFGLPKLPVLGEDAKLEIRCDAFNLFNILNFNPTSISNNINQSNFGQAQSALGSRTVSFQARFSF